MVWCGGKMERMTGEDGERRGEMIVDSEGTDRQ